MHQLKPLFAIQKSCGNTQPMEVVHQVNLNVIQPGLCLLHGIRFDAKGQVFCLGQAIVSLLKLLPEHHAIFCTNIVKTIVLKRNADALFKGIRIGGHIHKG